MNLFRITIKFNVNGALDNDESHIDENMDIEKMKNEESNAPVIKIFFIKFKNLNKPMFEF